MRAAGCTLGRMLMVHAVSLRHTLFSPTASHVANGFRFHW
jgi:hypothetical protein